MKATDPEAALTPLAVFGAELRYYRERAGLSQTALAGIVYTSHDVISKMETGTAAPAKGMPERLDAVAELDTGGALARLWQHLSKGMKNRAYPGWFQPWRDLEARAATLRWFELVYVPGLLQTEDYARAALRTRVKATDDEIAEMVVARLDRQAILTGDNPPMLWVILDEGVLRRPVGSAEIIRDQINHLIEAAKLPNIVIQVIPTNAGAHEGFRGPFIVADFDEAPSVGYQPAALRGQVIEDAADIAALMTIWNTLNAEATPRSASLRTMKEVAASWT